MKKLLFVSITFLFFISPLFSQKIKHPVFRNPCQGDAVAYFYDNDRDGVGNSEVWICICDDSSQQPADCLGLVTENGDPPSGYVTRGGDCDDNDASVQYQRLYYPDTDGDLFGDINHPGELHCHPPSNWVTNNSDCDDNNSSIHLVQNVYYSDADNDGFGNPYVFLVNQCTPPPGYVLNSDDQCPNEYGMYNGCESEPMNWITSKAFDVSGQLIGSGKVYYNELGRPIQSQSVDIRTGDTWASSTLYDNQGRAALQTMSAPVNNGILDFLYQPNFIRNSANQTYNSSDFETDIENPSAIGNQTGTLGWYYDEVNTNEPYQDVTDYPFSRTVFSRLNPGNVLKTIGGNKVDPDNDGNEEWINGFTYTVPAAQELFYAFGKGYFGSESSIDQSEEANQRFFKTVSIDIHGNESVVFTDSEGKTLALARSGGTQSYDVVSAIGEQGYVDVHIPQGIINNDILLLGFTNPSGYRIFDLRTEELVTVQELTGGNFYRIESLEAFEPASTLVNSNGLISLTPVVNTKGISYKVNYYDYALNYYDKTGRLVRSTQPLGFDENAFNLLTENPDHGLKSTSKFNAIGELLETSSPDEGTTKFIYREDGQIRFSQNSEQSIAGEFSYTNYDAQARPIESGVYDGPNSFSNEVAKGVTLKDVVRIKQEGNRIMRNSNTSWDAGIASVKMISGNGYIQWRFSNTHQRAMVGLSNSNPDHNYNSIKYAIYAYDGIIKIFESGTEKYSYGAYSTSDLFKITKSGSTIYYQVNDELIYTSLISESSNLLADMAFNTPNAAIEDFEESQVIVPTGTEVYHNVQNIGFNGSSVYKNAGSDTSWNDSGLNTSKMIVGDGAVQWKVNQTNKALMMGLSSHTTPTSKTYSYIDYALYFNVDGNVIAYEAGTWRKSLTTYTTNDTFKVERMGNQISYYKNGIWLYTSTMPSDSNELLFGKLSIRSLNAGINSISLINGDYHFKDFKNIAVNGNNLKKVPYYSWDGGFTSEETITGDGYVEFKTVNQQSHLMMGLSDSNINASYASIDYAIYIHRNQRVYIYESGSSKATLSFYDVGDSFRIERSGPTGVIKYYQNDQLLYTSSVNTTAPLVVDASFHDPLSTIEDLKLYDVIDSGNVVDPNSNLLIEDCKERHLTLYDVPDPTGLASALSTAGIASSNYPRQNFVAGNVSKTYTLNPATSTTWYSYDVYGRIEWLVQSIEGLGTKTLDYEYDPVHGQVTKVLYQKHVTRERFVHKYEYDAFGRLEKAFTSTDNFNFTEQANYSYYETGAMKRTYLNRVYQGIDYVYNLAGQLKAINDPALLPTVDPGGDGNDAFGMQIDYYDGDYKRTNTPTNILTTNIGENRYDGNIKAVRWSNKAVGDNSPLYHNSYVYKYDKNNWLNDATYGEFNSLSRTFTAAANDGYRVSNLQYDANGNLLSLIRNQDAAPMDNFTYNYNAGTNQLNNVSDSVAASAIDDLDSQNADNYEYNSIGQLVKNNQDNLEYIYNARGLVTQIKKDGEVLLNYLYDDRGQRVRKERLFGFNGYEYTHYVRDASGSVMAIYNEFKPDLAKIITFPTLKEHPIYGVSRLGVHYREGNTGTYQLTDHLGNVRAVLREGSSNYLSYTDYYPFGMPMPNRNLEGNYRYGYQGEYAEKEPELGNGQNSFELRLWDSRIGRWLTTDPAGQYASPYLGMGNNPINGIDSDGGFWEELRNWFAGKGWNSNAALAFQANGGVLGEWTGNPFTGYRNAGYIDEKGEFVGTIFNAVQDINSEAAVGFRVSAGLQAGFDISDTFAIDAAIFRTTLIEYNALNDEWFDAFSSNESRIEFLSADFAGSGANFGWTFSRQGKKNGNLFDANFSGEIQGGYTSLFQLGYKFDDESPLNGWYTQHGVEASGSLIVKVEIYHRHRLYHGAVLNKE